MPFRFDNTYARELEGAYVPWQPQPAPAPRTLYFDPVLAGELGLSAPDFAPEATAAVFSGSQLPAGAEPIAQAYAGHQFGGFSPQLGDGRALLLGEVIDRHGRRRDIAFKGSGRTPFSRGGDGRAALAPMLREVLIGEAMHALGVPTTRALAVVATGASIWRDMPVPGAVLTRVASSHLRVGTFQFFAVRDDDVRLRRLADYAIARHDPDLVGRPTRYADLLDAVVERQAALIARWMNIGFIHGVMNTDNMTLSGETIDYGPCAFLEAYDPAAVFSSIDHQGRYAYGNQPAMAQWNLARFAETLLPCLADDPDTALGLANAAIGRFPARYQAHLLAGRRARLGLRRARIEDETRDTALAETLLGLMHTQRVDFTLAWRRLAAAAEGDGAPLHAMFEDHAVLDAWLSDWRRRCAEEDGDATGSGQDPDAARSHAMRAASPAIIPRNHRVEEALAAASRDADLAPFERLLDALRRPFEEDPAVADLAEPAARDVTAAYRTFCGT